MLTRGAYWRLVTKKRRGETMLKLQEIGHGVIAEKFEDELAKVVANIMDVNTEAKTVREITLKVKVKPEPEDRRDCDLEIISSCKLAPSKAYVSKLAVGLNRVTGEVGAEEVARLQPALFDEPVAAEEKQEA